MRWTEKYRPKTFKDIVGMNKEKKVVETWVNSWKNGEKVEPLLLVGPAGTGKTTIAHVIANEFSDVIELNASDKRSHDIIMSTVGESATTKSFFTNTRNTNNLNNNNNNNNNIDNTNNINYKLIILDEVDGIHGREDSGGTRAIGKIIKESVHPIVMTANDFYSKRLTTIKTKCKVIKINKLRWPSINAHLRRICMKEGIDADPEAVKALARGSNGDMRSALNTLQVLTDETKKLSMEDLESVSQKDVTNNIFDSVMRVLKSQSIDKVKTSLRLDEDPTLVMEYIAENIPNEYEKPKEIKKAYAMISEADLYFGRARQTRNYTYWRYASDFMGVGVALSKDETYKKRTRITGAKTFALMGRTRGKRDLRDRIAEKMSSKLHMSNGVAISMFPYLEIMFENDDTAYDISNFLDLDDDEIKRFRKKKIPKSVITRKEKERQEEIANQKEIAKENDIIDSTETLGGLSQISKSQTIDSKSKEKLKKDSETDNASKPIESEKTSKPIEYEEVSKLIEAEKVSKPIEVEKPKTDDKKTLENLDNEKKQAKKEKPKETKKDSAQKSLFSF